MQNIDLFRIVIIITDPETFMEIPSRPINKDVAVDSSWQGSNTAVVRALKEMSSQRKMIQKSMEDLTRYVIFCRKHVPL